MAERQAIAFGASAGGLEALLKIVKDLPADLPAPAFVVVHCPPNFPSVLPEILSRSGPLPATHPQDGEEVRPGRIYVAPPNFYLALDGGRARVWFGPRVNGFRPAIDPLLCSAAEHCGAGAIGVILSGGMTDGVAGLLAVKRDGGVAVVQDPADAVVPVLPMNALSAVEADHVVPASEMGELLARLARGQVETGATAMPGPAEARSASEGGGRGETRAVGVVTWLKATEAKSSKGLQGGAAPPPHAGQNRPASSCVLSWQPGSGSNTSPDRMRRTSPRQR
jgi:two-component system chemotaxis response regulator CheB